MSQSARLIAAIRRFATRDEGSIAFEAIWVGLFLAFLIAPTIYVYQSAVTRLDGSWMQRFSTRQHAETGSCNEIPLANAPINVSTGVNSINTVNCSTTASAEPDNDKQWPVMDRAVQSDFPTLLDDLKNEGDFEVHSSNLRTVDTATFELGQNTDGSSLFNQVVNIAGGLLDTTPAMAPSTEFYNADGNVWSRGHDRVIWAEITEDARQMFPNVFPSK